MSEEISFSGRNPGRLRQSIEFFLASPEPVMNILCPNLERAESCAKRIESHWPKLTTKVVTARSEGQQVQYRLDDGPWQMPPNIIETHCVEVSK